MKKVVQKIAVGGVIVYQNKVLIIQRADNDDFHPGLWEIPGGKKEPMEIIADALKREIKEETGLEVEINNHIGAFQYTVEKKDEIRDVVQLSYLVKIIGSVEVKLSKEHQKFAWITENEIDNYNISDETKTTLRSAFNI